MPFGGGKSSEQCSEITRARPRLHSHGSSAPILLSSFRLLRPRNEPDTVHGPGGGKRNLIERTTYSGASPESVIVGVGLQE